MLLHSILFYSIVLTVQDTEERSTEQIRRHNRWQICAESERYVMCRLLLPKHSIYFLLLSHYTDTVISPAIFSSSILPSPFFSSPSLIPISTCLALPSLSLHSYYISPPPPSPSHSVSSPFTPSHPL